MLRAFASELADDLAALAYPPRVGKKNRVKARAATASDTTAEGVGPRQPCPCGSGRRYRNCHGSAAGAPPAFVARPFAGLPGECDLVALREFVPAATAPLALADGRTVTLCSLLPGAAPGVVRGDGSLWLGLQVLHAYGDASRDLAAVLEKAGDAEAGSVVGLNEAPGEGPRLQDLVDGSQRLEVTVHEGFEFWLEDSAGDEAREALHELNHQVHPTVRLPGDRAAYWTSVGDREFLRWAMPEDEDALLDALARLHHAGQDRLVEGARLIGMFRALGVLVPVWDLPLGTGAGVLDAPVAAFADALAAALAAGGPLTAEERATRNGLASRQLTLR